MAIRLIDVYPNRTGAANSNYPHGSIVNESAPDAGDGTPLERQWGNDLAGFMQALLETADITPSGSPDTAPDSQHMDALLDVTRGLTEVDVAGDTNVTLATYDRRMAMVRLTGTLTADIDIIVPDTARHYVFINATSGSFAVTVKTSGGSGVSVRKGNAQWLYSDGTNVNRVSNVADMEHAGDPNGNLAADTLYQRAWDTSSSPSEPYIATSADGTVVGTTWTKVQDLIGATSSASATSDLAIATLAAFGINTGELSGTGIPGAIGRGAIVESGSNANGAYIRWSNGEQACWIPYADRIGGSSPTTWTYPAAFASSPFAISIPTVSDAFMATVDNVTTTEADLYQFSDQGSANTGNRIATAWGNWK